MHGKVLKTVKTDSKNTTGTLSPARFFLIGISFRRIHAHGKTPLQYTAELR